MPFSMDPFSPEGLKTVYFNRRYAGINRVSVPCHTIDWQECIDS